MVVTIQEFQPPSRYYKFYEVTIHNRVIKTTVTASPGVANRWINDHLQASFPNEQKIAGLDIEWCPSSGVPNSVATLQLCVHRNCLIFQINHACRIPQSLYEALRNPYITYTGVKIGYCAEKLFHDYGLAITYRADVAAMAAVEYNNRRLRNTGLKSLVRGIMREEIDEPEHIRISNWDARQLSRAQVKYACVDAFYSCILGSILISRRTQVGAGGHTFRRVPHRVETSSGLSIWSEIGIAAVVTASALIVRASQKLSQCRTLRSVIKTLRLRISRAADLV